MTKADFIEVMLADWLDAELAHRFSQFGYGRNLAEQREAADDYRRILAAELAGEA